MPEPTIEEIISYWRQKWPSLTHFRGCVMVHAACAIHALVAEIERLREENARLRKEATKESHAG